MRPEAGAQSLLLPQLIIVVSVASSSVWLCSVISLDYLGIGGCHARLFCSFVLLTRRFFCVYVLCVVLLLRPPPRRCDAFRQALYWACKEDGHCCSWVLYCGECNVCVTYVLLLLCVSLALAKSRGCGPCEIWEVISWCRFNKTLYWCVYYDAFCAGQLNFVEISFAEVSKQITEVLAVKHFYRLQPVLSSSLGIEPVVVQSHCCNSGTLITSKS